METANTNTVEVVDPERDDRGGLPSASKAEQWTLCPGSHLAQQGLKAEQGDDAAEGIRLHAEMEFHERCNKKALLLPELPYLKELTESQREVLAFTTKLRNELVSQVVRLSGWAHEEATEKLAEGRLWLRDEDTLDPLSSARLDLAIRLGSWALIVDYKFGRAAVEHAAGNLQLREQAICLAQELPDLGDVCVAIVAPRAEGETKTTLARYKAGDFRTAYCEMASAARLAVQPGQPRIAGAKQCKHCLAAGTDRCPESRAIVGAALLAANDKEALARPVTADELDKIAFAEELLGEYAEKRRAEAREMLAANPEAIPGWELQPGKKTAKVRSASDAYARLCIKMGAADFAQACTLSLPELAERWKTAAGHKSLKAARDDLERLLDDLIQRGQSAPSLKRRAA